jgi:hypothetical protein
MSPADEETPLHNNNTIPAKATHSKNRVLVKKIQITLVGGSRDLAAFQFTPPLGRSIAPLLVASSPPLQKSEINQSVQKRAMHPGLRRRDEPKDEPNDEPNDARAPAAWTIGSGMDVERRRRRRRRG